jgi:L-alanine-DL-glutamate epimerase-like enolase superfamily enzyme
VQVSLIFDLPEGPGLGVTISDAKVEEYRVPDIAL